MLSQSDWKRINDVTLIIHSETDIDDMRKHFFDAVRVLIPYEKAMFYFIDEHDHDMKLRAPVFVNVDDSFAKLYERVFSEFSYGRVAISARRTMAFNDSELINEGEREATDMFKSFMQPYKVPYGAGIEIAKNRKPTAEVSFFRTQEQGDFTEREMKVLDILKDHLEVRINNEIKDENKEEQKKIILIDLGLTEREIEILGMIENSYETDVIAEELEIAKSTVKRHLHNIYSKLEVSGRLALLSFINKI